MPPLDKSPQFPLRINIHTDISGIYLPIYGMYKAIVIVLYMYTHAHIVYIRRHAAVNKTIAADR